MIVERVANTTGQVDASTVYRTLDELARIGVVHLIHLGNGQPGMWHLTLDHGHEHLVCEGCGRTIEVPRSDFDPSTTCCEPSTVSSPTLITSLFLGFCRDCEPLTDHYHSVGRSSRSEVRAAWDQSGFQGPYLVTRYVARNPLSHVPSGLPGWKPCGLRRRYLTLSSEGA